MKNKHLDYYFWQRRTRTKGKITLLAKILLQHECFCVAGAMYDTTVILGMPLSRVNYESGSGTTGVVFLKGTLVAQMSATETGLERFHYGNVTFTIHLKQTD